ncbi:MAG TPA: NUDIX domain-containing protein [Candidatus Limnocylindrales bacterium]|nr:NUDIX domain-containing protein [Candidatus Limnocylindrales bacterium]
MTALAISLIGSFRQYYSEVRRAAEVFVSASLEVRSPTICEITNEGAPFVRFKSDPPNSLDHHIQTATFDKILSSDVIYVVAPNGYIGPTTNLELGRILERGLPVFYSERPQDLPIPVPDSTVHSPGSLVDLLKRERLPRQRVRPFAAADRVVLTVRDARLHVLLVRRGTDPYRGKLALPGGFVRPGESLDDTASREFAEETGIPNADLPLRQLHTYSDPKRDPRGIVHTTAFLAISAAQPEPAGGSDAENADWVEIEPTLPTRLAFDHAVILGDAVAEVRRLVEYTPLALSFCPDLFTLTDLRRVYEAVWDVKLDAGNFNKKLTDPRRGLIESTILARQGDNGRPSKLYRRGPASHEPYIWPPVLPPRRVD